MSRWFTWLLATLACVLFLHLLTERASLFGLTARFWLNRAYALAVVGALAILLVGVGRAVLLLPWLRDCRLTGMELLLMGFALGVCTVSAFLLILAMSAGLSTAGLFVAMIASGIAAFIGFARVPATVESARKDEAGASRWLKFSTVVVLAVWSLPHLIQTVLPNTDWDAAMYHLPLAERYLKVGVWVVDPYSQHLNFPGSLHLFYSVFLALEAESAVIPFSFLLGLLLPASCFVLADRFWGRSAGWWAALIACACNVIWELCLTPRIDAGLGTFVVLAVLALLRWDADRSQRGFLLIVGALLGLMVGAKYTAAAYPLVLLPLAGVLSWRDLRRQFPALVGAAVLVAVPASFWYVRNTVVLSDPMYPLLRKVPLHVDSEGRLVPFADALADGMARHPLSNAETEAALRNSPLAFVCDLSSEKAEGLRNLLNVWDVWRNPSHYSRDEFDWMSTFVLVGLLLPLASRDRPALLLLGIGLALWLLVGGTVHLLRYLVPVIALFAVAAGVVLAKAGERWGAWATVPLLALLVSELGLNAATQWAKLRRTQPAALLRGEESEIDFVCRTGYSRERGHAPAIRFLNAYLEEHPEDRGGRALILGQAPTFLHRAPSEQSVAEYRWLGYVLRADGDPERVVKVLREEGVRFLIVSPYCYEWEALHQRSLTPEETRQIRWSSTYLMRLVSDVSKAATIFRHPPETGNGLKESELVFIVRLKDTPNVEPANGER